MRGTLSGACICPQKPACPKQSPFPVHLHPDNLQAASRLWMRLPQALPINQIAQFAGFVSGCPQQSESQVRATQEGGLVHHSCVQPGNSLCVAVPSFLTTGSYC